MTEIEALSQRVRDRFPDARLEIEGSTLYIELGPAQYHVTFDGLYSFHQEAVGYQDAVSYDLSTPEEVLEAIIPPARPKAKPVDPLDLDELERIATAALPSSWHPKWKDEAGFNNAGCPTRFFYIPGHNDNKKVEMMAETSEHIVAFQPEVVLRLIAAARTKT